jgi:hypothetical protein
MEVNVQLQDPTSSPPKEGVPIPLEFDAWRVPGPISKHLRKEKYLAPTANRNTHSLVARHNLKNREASYRLVWIFIPRQSAHRVQNPFTECNLLKASALIFISCIFIPLCWRKLFNLQEPCVLYKGRAYRYPPDVAFYIYFFQQIQVLSILNMLHTLCFLFKMPFIS